MRISVHDTQPLQFTLTCTSAFGPATTVIWMRDSEVVEGGMSVLTNSLTPTYRHTLTASEEGVYTCTVSNNLPSTATATLNITSMYIFAYHSLLSYVHFDYFSHSEQDLPLPLTSVCLRMDRTVCWFHGYHQMELRATLSTTRVMEDVDYHGKLRLMTLPSLYFHSVVARHIQLA